MERSIDARFRSELIDSSAFIAPNATVRGEAIIGAEASIWFGAVVRGDVERVTVGDQSNVQDLCVLHSDPGFPCYVGKRVTIGHGAIVHGARVEDGCLIGMRATVLNGATIGSGSLVGAGAVVAENSKIPPNSLVVGCPARVIREIGETLRERISRGWRHYVDAAAAYRDQRLQDSDS